MKTNSDILLYALAFNLLTAACPAQGIKPVERQPVAAHVAALKNSGHQRIAQGVQTAFAKSETTAELTEVESPLMLTTNKQNGEWTVSLVHDKVAGSTLLIGNNLREIAQGDPMPPFDRANATRVIQRLQECGGAFYPDKIAALSGKLGLRRVFTGEVTFMMDLALETAQGYHQFEIDAHRLKLNVGGEDIEIAQGDLRRVMVKRMQELQGQPGQAKQEPEPVRKDAIKPLFADVLVSPKGGFMVLLVDQSGACVPVAVGDGFSENR